MLEVMNLIAFILMIRFTPTNGKLLEHSSTAWLFSAEYTSSLEASLSIVILMSTRQKVTKTGLA